VLLFDNIMSIDSSPMELLTIAEVAEFLKLSAPTVRRLQQQRRIAFVKVGGRVRFTRSDIMAYLESRRVSSIDRTNV
jgi:excisionase family DNA binding protein